MLVEAADAALDRDPATAREHLRLAARSARENLAETRAIVAALTPAPLHGARLGDALRRLLDRFVEETGIAATLSIVGDSRPLATGAEVVSLRVVQEALHNVRKHARASSVRIALSFVDDGVRVEVRDDGVGFDPAEYGGGYGLDGMRARVEQVGGTLSISTAPGLGATIRTEVPT
jgi:signal transduction histidine kinase